MGRLRTIWAVFDRTMVVYWSRPLPVRNTGREQLANACRIEKLDEILKDVETRGKSIRLGD